MTSVPTSAAVDWVTLATPEFVGWTRLVDIALPYPLSTSNLPYITAPDAETTRRVLRERGLEESAVLEAAQAALSNPRLIVYAVRVSAEGRESKYVAVAGRDDEHAVLVLLDERQVSVRTVADTELAAGVAGSLPQLAGLRFPGVEVPVSALRGIDSVVGSESPRTVRGEMQRAGLPEQLLAVQEQTAPGPMPTGVIGAVGFRPDDPVGSAGRHATRNASWREFPAGAVLQIDRARRHGEDMSLLVPYSADDVFRAAVDAVASVYEGG